MKKYITFLAGLLFLAGCGSGAVTGSSPKESYKVVKTHTYNEDGGDVEYGTFTYNSAGYVETQVINDFTNPELTTVFEYDEEGNIVKKNAKTDSSEDRWGEEETAYENMYDENHRLIEQIGHSKVFYFRENTFDSTETFEFDDKNRVIKSEIVLTTPENEEVIDEVTETYTYDKDCNVATITKNNDSGVTVEKYEYDKNKNKTKLISEYTGNGAGAETTISEYKNEYDEHQNLVKITTNTYLPNGSNKITYTENEYSLITILPNAQ